MGATSNAEHPSVPSFASAEGLRAVLNRLQEAGPGAWQNDPEARALLLFAVQKYRRLALKWHRDEADAAHAAFLAMIASNTRRADDPWAIVTTAVSRTLKAETRADRHMISTERARHPQKLAKEPPVRAGEHEEFVFDILRTAPGRDASDGSDESGITEAVRFLSALGWPADVAQAGVEYVTDRLTSAGNRDTAFESLRRDASIPAQLDIPRSSWTKLVRLLLGGKTRPGFPSQRGILLRVVSGETAEVLLTDDALVLDVVEATGSGWLE
jgi:hypothetical protein